MTTRITEPWLSQELLFCINLLASYQQLHWPIITAVIKHNKPNTMPSIQYDHFSFLFSTLCLALVTQVCPTLCDPMDCVAHQAPLSMTFFRQKCWSEQPFPSLGDLPDPGIKPGSPTLQADSLPSEPPGKLPNACHRSPQNCYLSIYYKVLNQLYLLQSIQIKKKCSLNQCI